MSEVGGGLDGGEIRRATHSLRRARVEFDVAEYSCSARKPEDFARRQSDSLRDFFGLPAFDEIQLEGRFVLVEALRSISFSVRLSKLLRTVGLGPPGLRVFVFLFGVFDALP